MKLILSRDLDLSKLREQRLWTDEQFEQARRIVDDVRLRGATALREWTERLDRSKPRGLLLGRKELHLLAKEVDSDATETIKRAARLIERFAKEQLKSLRPVSIQPAEGVTAEARITPLDSAGAYVPGGRYPLISSALHCCIPPRVAGVGRLVAATPPGPDGSIDPTMALALKVAGVDELLLAGGAQAIAALAYGIEGLQPVDRIAGPGNVYVTAAKYIVSQHTGIDMLAGPSEVLIIADEHASAELICADLLAQAEHDPRALPLLFTDSQSKAEQVVAKLETALPELPTAQVAAQALKRGAIVLFERIEQALEQADALAPEHLELHLKDPTRYAGRLRNFGSLFVGSLAAEVLGDYSAGINHVLPTGGAARYRAGLSVLDFVKVQTVLRAKAGKGLNSIAELAAQLARLEGLHAHQRAAQLRTKIDDDQ
ncbi:MAG: histidinol dehydrogenase [Candidatus Alcyoniella australis]|nr:histidinol dehydrogenase [Candidatus Alcyoniella australis]